MKGPAKRTENDDVRFRESLERLIVKSIQKFCDNLCEMKPELSEEYILVAQKHWDENQPYITGNMYTQTDFKRMIEIAKTLPAMEEMPDDARLMWRDSAKCYMERHKLMLEENNTQEGFVYHQ